MAYEMTIGLQVNNDESYNQYREAMTPILQSFGGGFRYDFKISETLKNAEQRPINRVFVIYFRDKEAMQSCFSHPDYIAAKKQFFAPAVEATTIIAAYDRL